MVLAAEDWHPGVVGIAASKIMETYNRPVILLSLDENLARGSGRSNRRFSLFRALTQCHDFLDHYGGHDQAAGLTLSRERVPDLAEALEEIAAREIGEASLIPSLEIEAMAHPRELDDSLFDHLFRLAPFGAGNPEPTLAVTGLTVLSCTTVGRNHLKLRLKREGRILDVIGFGLGDRLVDLGPEVAVALRPLMSYYNGRFFPGLADGRCEESGFDRKPRSGIAGLTAPPPDSLGDYLLSFRPAASGLLFLKYFRNSSFWFKSTTVF